MIFMIALIDFIGLAVVFGIMPGVAIVCGKAWYEVQWNPDWRKSNWEKFKDEIHYIFFNTYEREDLD
jgi:hypothetical protein